MQWSSERKVIYAVLVIFATVALGVFGFRSILFPTPTCTDQKKNGYEEGIDCGGLCSRVCVEQVIPISVLWSRVLPVSPGIYDIVGLISNRNQGSAPSVFGVTFSVLNQNGETIFTRKVGAIPPTTGDIPVILQNISLKEEPKKVVIVPEEGTYYKIREAFQSAQISVARSSFENGETPRVYATIRNLTRSNFINFPVRVVLFDETQTAIGVGETFVERLNKEEESTVIFTWKSKFETPPVTIKVYPVLNPFSSSY